MILDPIIHLEAIKRTAKKGRLEVGIEIICGQWHHAESNSLAQGVRREPASL